MDSQGDAEMPRYQCHKKVWALKISMIKAPDPDKPDDGSRVIVPAEQGYGPFRVDAAYMAKHNPQEGGYYVVYDDGYKSFSPAKAFEDGYSPMNPRIMAASGQPWSPTVT